MANNINAAAKAWVISQLAQIGILAIAAKKGIVATLPNGAIRKIQVAARSNDDHPAGVGPIKELDFDFYVVVPVKKNGIEWGFVFSRDEIANAPLNSDAMSNHAFSRDPNPSADGKIHVWQLPRRYRKPKHANAWSLIAES